MCYNANKIFSPVNRFCFSSRIVGEIAHTSKHQEVFFMKKLTLAIAVTASVLILSATSAFAANNFSGQNFVDQNMDGICDNCTGTGKGNGLIDADGDGVCDNYTGTGKGNGFTDTDGDGVCDNQLRPQNGTGKQFGRNR